jgi:hypothetical protein
MNGIFYNLSTENLSLIRFYDDGEVIGITYEKEENYEKELIEILDRNHLITKLHPDLLSKGFYSKNDNEINFKLTTQGNETDYSGQIINTEEIIFNSFNFSTNFKNIARYNSINLFPQRNDLINISDLSYPIVLVPNKIKTSLINEPTNYNIYNHLNIELPKLNLLKEPIKPSSYKYITSETSKFQGSGCMTFAYIPMIVFFAYMAFYCLTTSNPLLGLLFFGFVIFLIPNLGKFKTETNSKKVNLSKEEFERQINEFENELQNVKSKNAEIKKNYDNKFSEIKNSILPRIDELKKEIHFNSLKPLTFAKRNLENINRGKYELLFLNLLYAEFGEQIKVDFAPNLDYETYYPDFTFICNKTNLHIDIEIDEPYSLLDKKPIHHTESNDDERNRFFLEQNWCVIRFSEKQIATQSKECINLLKSFINSILEKTETYENNIEKDLRWSYEKALIMSFNDYRKTY